MKHITRHLVAYMLVGQLLALVAMALLLWFVLLPATS